MSRQFTRKRKWSGNLQSDGHHSKLLAYSAIFSLSHWPRLKGLTTPRGEEDRPSLTLSQGLAVDGTARPEVGEFGPAHRFKCPFIPDMSFSTITTPTKPPRSGQFLCTRDRPPTRCGGHWAASWGGRPAPSGRLH